MTQTPAGRDALRFIDVHHHTVLPEYQQALVRSGAADPSRPIRKNGDPAQALEAMASLGIDAAIINPLSVAGVHHGDDENARYLCRSVNESLAKFVSHAPARMGFFAPIPFPDVDGALREMEHALDHLGADGLIMLTNQNDRYIGDPAYEAIYAEMDRRGAVVFVHPARPSFVDGLNLKLWASVVEYPFETTRIAANLIYNGFMKKYPKIKWILAHAGGCLPYLSLRLKLMEESDEYKPTFAQRHPEGAGHYVDKFYYDTAIAGSRAAMLALREVADMDKVMFGSDWPYIDRHYVEEQNASLLNLRDREFGAELFAKIERGNAAALFPRFR
ncbi:MAG: amidohydrolase 2 [Hyphomicrobiales bacterium]|nr:amidohydrolase 2 [Hyphomicrobiales bacterium]